MNLWVCGSIKIKDKEWIFNKIDEFVSALEKYGKTACSVRNEEMVKLADFVLILWNGTSYGTFKDICLCEKYNRPYKICYYGTQPTGNKYFVMAMEKLRNQFATANKDFLNTVIEKAYEIQAANIH